MTNGRGPEPSRLGWLIIYTVVIITAVVLIAKRVIRSIIEWLT